MKPHAEPETISREMLVIPIEKGYGNNMNGDRCLEEGMERGKKERQRYRKLSFYILS